MTTSNLRRLALLAACTVFSNLLIPVAHAQTAAYPDKPVRIIVPFPPGGVADTVGRPVAQALAKELNQSVTIENKPGAGGGLGIAQAARAKPDGYTLLMSLSSMTTIPEADKALLLKLTPASYIGDAKLLASQI